MHTFTLTGSDGEQHEYEVMPHPPSEGFGVVSRVAAALIDPLAGTALSVLVKVVPEALKGARTADGKVDIAAILDNEELVNKIGALDFGNAGPALQRAIERFDLALVKAILQHTTRDGKALKGTLAFDTAYVQNYGELLAAVWEVCSYNRFFPLPAGFGNLEQLGAGLLRRKAS
jgi:hypothetical protein